MAKTLQERLERLKHHRTRYEMAMIRGDEKILICYSPGRSRRDIHGAVCDDRRRDKIIAAAGADSIYFEKRKADGARMGEWKINFTGRTQRESYIEGELPYIGDRACPATPTP